MRGLVRVGAAVPSLALVWCHGDDLFVCLAVCCGFGRSPGSGVCASHGMERTHVKGLEATLKLMYLYLCGEE